MKGNKTMTLIKNSENKIVRRVINNRAYIENMTLYVDGKIYAYIGGSFNLRDAIDLGKLFD